MPARGLRYFREELAVDGATELALVREFNGVLGALEAQAGAASARSWERWVRSGT